MYNSIFNLEIFFIGSSTLRILRPQMEQNEVPLSTLFEVVNTVRSFGNRCFSLSHYDNAKDRYKQVNHVLKRHYSL